MKFLLKRVESVFYFALVLFAFPCFATEVYEEGEVTKCHFDSTTMQRFLRFTTGTGCSSGKMCVKRFVRQGGRGSSPKLMDICLPPGNLCPAGSTRVERPIPIASYNSNDVQCGNLKYIDSSRIYEDSNWFSDTSLYSEADRGLLRTCWITINPPDDHLDRNKCSIYFEQGHLKLYATCAPGNDRKCKETLRKMIAGEVTLQKQSISMRPSRRPEQCGYPNRIDNKYTCTSGQCVREENVSGLKAHYKCEWHLYDRTTDTVLPNQFLTFYASSGGRDKILQAGHLSDLECLSYSIRFGNVCECNDGDYKFDASQNDSCFCPDETAKSSDGSCSDSCPIGPDGRKCPLDPDTGQCACVYQCPDSPCNATFVHSIMPSSSPVAPPAHPDPNAPIPPASACQCPTTNKCASEANWDPQNLYNYTPASPIHSEISLGPSGNANDTARCPEGTLKDASLPTAYCEKDQTCSAITTTDQKACTSQTINTGYGQCQPAIVRKKVFIAENSPTLVKGGSCPNDWPEYKTTRPDLHTVCHSPDGANTIVIDTRSTQPSGLSLSATASAYPYIKLDPNQHLPNPRCRSGVTKVRVGNYTLCARTVSSNEIANNPDILEGAYTCPEGGIPSSQSASCECQATVTEEGCGGGYIRQADVTSGACNCPDASWDLDNGKCSKTPSGPDITEVRIAEYEGNYDGDGSDLYLDPGINTSLPVNQGIPETAQSAINAGWTCTNNNYSGGLSKLFNRQPTLSYTIATCTKTTTTKECPEGGTYNTSTQKCEMFCTQESNIQNCKCVKDTVGNRCDCPLGWIQDDTKCRRPAEPVQKKCICACYKNTSQKGEKNAEFSVGDEIDLAIKADFSKCLDENNVACDEKGPPCCYQGTIIAPCDSTTEAQLIAGGHPINVMGDGTCSECPDGNKVPASPGGCCANGKAVNDLSQCTSPQGGDPKGIDIAFRGNSSYFYSVYSTGSMDRPDYICWRRITTGGSGYQKVQMRELVCPSKGDCGGKARDPVTKMCQCQSLDASDNVISHRNTYCEYASRDPMRFEDGIVRGDVPSSRENDKYHTDIRFFKTNIIATPGGR